MNSIKGNCGFKNYGNTCWLNTALQCLLKCDELNVFIKNNSFNQDTILYQYKLLINGIKNENCIISPVSFIKKLDTKLKKIIIF